MNSGKITRSELANHNTAQSCWIAINGVVFDVTEFIKHHPGGADTIMNYAGKDVTEAFESIGHSQNALQHLETLMIGLLEGTNFVWFS